MAEAFVKKSKYLSFLLRHHPEEARLDMTKNGYVKVEQLISNTDITKEELDMIVKTDNKQRYSYSEDKKMIRANQGHSISWVEIDFEEVTIKDIKDLGGYLYHGTSKDRKESILEKGILKGSRNYVHLSRDVKTALNVGRRHGEPTVLKVDAIKMIKEGLKVYKSKNGIYLVDFVDINYIEE